MVACENGAQAPEAANANLRNVSVAEAAQLLKSDEKVIVLDVRSGREFSTGHIDGAVNVSFHESDFEAQLSALDRDATYVLTCESGGRSTRTMRKLKKMGFVDVAHLKSGMAGWRNERLPTRTLD